MNTLLPFEDRRVRMIPPSPLTCLLLAVVVLSSNAQAQQGVTGVEPSLETVTVTARKLEERLQDVPAPVISLSATQLQNDYVNDLNALTREVPGLNVATNEPNHLILSIRGITSASERPTVGFYVDDIPIDTAYHDLTGQYEPPILDLGRVEVLEGPQGSLYGGSAMGGAVKYISRRPNFDRFQLDGRGEISTTQDGGVGNFEAIVANAPISGDSLALRLALSHNEIAGYIDRVAHAEGVSPTVAGRTTFTSLNTANESKINDYTVDSAKATLLWLPAAGIEVIPHFMYQRTQTPDASQVWPNLPGYESSFAIAQPVKDSFALYSVTVNKSFLFGDFTSITGFVKATDATTQDFWGFNSAIFPNLGAFANAPSFEGMTNTSLTQEFRFSRNDKNSPFGYVAGAYYRNLKVASYQNILSVGSGVTSQTLPPDWIYGDHQTRWSREQAVFGEGYYRVGIFELTLGGRAYKLRADFLYSADGILNGGASQTFQSERQSGFSPKAAISAKLSQDHLLYALASQGFRIGGGDFIPPNVCAADLAKLGLSTSPTSYKSDTLWNYEVGSKNVFASGSLTANVSAFYLDWSKLQQVVILPCGYGFVGNVGAAVSKGVELQLAYRPVEQLTLMAGVVYDNARVTKTVPFIPAQVGDPIELAPDWVGNVSADYRFPLQGVVFGELHADFQYHGSQTQSFNKTIVTDVNPITGAPLGAQETQPDPAYLTAAYHVLNASVGIGSKRWSARLLVQNALNGRPLLGLTESYQLMNTTYSLTPRTYRLVMEFHY